MEQKQPRVSAFSIGLFAVSTFFFWASLYIYVPILPLHAQQQGASHQMVGLVVGAYGVTQFLLRVPLGVWSDRLGRRKPFISAGMLAAALGALGLALSPDPWLLFLSRALTGVAASAWVAFTVLFSSYFAAGRAVRAMSLVTFVTGIAQMVATYSGGVIAQAFGNAATFYVGVALAVAGYLLSLRLYEETRPVASPLSPERVLRIITVPLLLAVSFNAILSQYTAFVTTYAFTPIYAEQLGATQADQGFLVTANLLPYTIGMLFVSAFGDKIGNRTLVAWGMGLAAVGVFVTPLTGTFPLLVGAQALNGFGRGLAFPVLMGLSIQAVPQAERATAMGVFQSVYAIGMFAGPVVGGGIADAFGLPSVFFSTAAVCLVSVLIGLATIPARKR